MQIPSVTFLFLTILATSSCVAAPPTFNSIMRTPSRLAQAISTITPKSSSAPSKASSVATATADLLYGLVLEQSLPHGQALAYVKALGQQRYLVLVASDASGASVLPLPQNAVFAKEPINGLSPDGRYFAYFNGGVGSWSEPSTAEGKQFFLNILDLPNAEPVTSIPLLSENYPDDLLSTVSALEGKPPEGYEGASQEDIALGVYNAFSSGVGSLDWAPESDRLAYASQNPGPTSDLFIFSPETGKSTRLSAGPEMIQSIKWSSDGAWIAHSSVAALAMDVNDSWHFARPDSSGVVSFPSVGSPSPGWISPDLFIVTDGANGIGTFNLKLLDPTRGREIDLWPHPYNVCAIDPASSLLAISVMETRDDSDPPPGTYLGPYHPTFPQLIDSRPFSSLYYWGTPEIQFLGETIDDALVGVSASGSIKRLAHLSATIVPSPDQKYLALRLWDPTPAGLSILDMESFAQTTIAQGRIGDIIWSPDSSGLFYVTQNKLFYLDQATLNSTLIDGDLGEDEWWVSFRWVTLD
jgi:hypothetical protein